jgi:UDP-glucose 4-epimerase
MSNVFGPRQDPHGEAGVIAIFCGAAATGDTVYMYGDGSQTRDFIYVGDVVEAFLAAGRGSARGALNVSTGRETSLRELVEELSLDPEPRPARAGEVLRSCLDPGAAARELGWAAKTPLAEGLRLTLAAHPGRELAR